MHWTVRPARALDRAALAELLAAQALPADDLASDRGDVVVAVAGTGIVGCAGLERYRPDVLLRSVAVALSWRDRGVGATLIGAMVDRARHLDARALYLLTPSAGPYVAAHDFMPIGRDPLPAAIAASPQAARPCPRSAQAMGFPLSSPWPRA